MACVYCNCEVYEVWNLGFFPPSDIFCDSKKSALNIQTEKLAVGCCRSCGLTQNTVQQKTKLKKKHWLLNFDKKMDELIIERTNQVLDNW